MDGRPAMRVLGYGHALPLHPGLAGCGKTRLDGPKGFPGVLEKFCTVAGMSNMDNPTLSFTFALNELIRLCLLRWQDERRQSTFRAPKSTLS
jgi:hypothetical protein